jgi:hypothetical protein
MIFSRIITIPKLGVYSLPATAFMPTANREIKNVVIEYNFTGISEKAFIP